MDRRRRGGFLGPEQLETADPQDGAEDRLEAFERLAEQRAKDEVAAALEPDRAEGERGGAADGGGLEFGGGEFVTEGDVGERTGFDGGRDPDRDGPAGAAVYASSSSDAASASA